MSNNFSTTAAFIWSVAGLLRGDFKQARYGHVVQPFTSRQCPECVLRTSKVSAFVKLDLADIPTPPGLVRLVTSLYMDVESFA